MFGAGVYVGTSETSQDTEDFGPDKSDSNTVSEAYMCSALEHNM
jgi:hypothetical protein